MQDPSSILSELISAQQGRLSCYPEQQVLKCPRCDSTNTKFCYYNNYNLSQPRHFCKSCRRYWTKGGTLRNIPVGGASRKPPKRPKLPESDPDPKAGTTTPPSLQLGSGSEEARSLQGINGWPDLSIRSSTGSEFELIN